MFGIKSCSKISTCSIVKLKGLKSSKIQHSRLKIYCLFRFQYFSTVWAWVLWSYQFGVHRTIFTTIEVITILWQNVLWRKSDLRCLAIFDLIPIYSQSFSKQNRNIFLHSRLISNTLHINSYSLICNCKKW